MDMEQFCARLLIEQRETVEAIQQPVTVIWSRNG